MSKKSIFRGAKIMLQGIYAAIWLGLAVGAFYIVTLFSGYVAVLAFLAAVALVGLALVELGSLGRAYRPRKKRHSKK